MPSLADSVWGKKKWRKQESVAYIGSIIKFIDHWFKNSTKPRDTFLLKYGGEGFFSNIIWWHPEGKCLIWIDIMENPTI